MEWLNVEILARVQFAVTVMFHYIFPPLSIGLGTLLVIMEGLFLITGKPIYSQMCRFWTKIFAVNFALGVATGIVMQVEFGTNWAVYSKYVGDIFGSALAAEGIFAFFLESGFLAVLLYGWNRVSPRVHFFSTCMVALGATGSAYWITVANSWMQTPAGFEIVGEGLGARAQITDFWAMVFNPSATYRFAHVVIGSWLTGAFFVMSISAWYILKGRHQELARRSFTIALIFAAVSGPLQAWFGARQAEIVAKYQPAKLAAYEGHFETGPNAPVYLFGIPDEKSGEVRWGVKVPGLLSWLIHGDSSKPVKGLNDFAPEDRPKVMIPFQCYHGMIALGMYMIGLAWLGVFLLWRGKLFSNRFILWVFVYTVFAPYIANQLGWIGTETGRQPWIVQGLLRTSDALSKAVNAETIVWSLILFGLVYLVLFLLFVWTLDRKIKQGPDEDGKPKRGLTGMRDLLDVHRDRLDPARHPDRQEDK